MDRSKILKYEGDALYGLLIVLVFIVVTIIYKIRAPLTFDNYVSNTYLYIILAILVCTITLLVMDIYQFSIFKNYSPMKYLGFFIITVVLLVILIFMSKDNIVLQHIVWIMFIISIAILIFPSSQLSKEAGVILKSIMTVIVIVLGLSFFARKLPENYFDSWKGYLLLGLISLIILEIIDYFFGSNKYELSREKLYSMIAILIFSGFILYDTKRLHKNADVVISSCKDIKNIREQLLCAEYPINSLGFFIHIINLFANVSKLIR